jgi:hypothetical protein
MSVVLLSSYAFHVYSFMRILGYFCHVLSNENYPLNKKPTLQVFMFVSEKYTYCIAKVLIVLHCPLVR